MGKRRTKETKKRFKKRWIVLIVLLILLVAGGIYAARFMNKVEENGGGVQGIIATALGQDSTTLANLDPIYCLVVGKSEGMTDTILVCAYSPKTQEASMLSIPRDTFYGKNKDTATAFYKINALYSKGPKYLLKEVESILGIDIPYYAIIDTHGVIELVDALGGVMFDVPIDMYYNDPTQDLHINLKAGEQLIDGKKAEQLLRFRHNDDGSSYPIEYGDQDYGRMRTQREFIMATIEQKLKLSTITKINDIIEIVFKNLETNLVLDDVLDYVPYAVNFNVANLKSDRLPGNSEKCNGVWLFIKNEKTTKEVVKNLFKFDKEKDSNEEVEQIGEGIRVEILNASGDPDKVEKLQKDLKEKGYNISKITTTSVVELTTIIERKDHEETTDENLLSNFESEDINIIKGEESSSLDYTIILGEDF